MSRATTEFFKMPRDGVIPPGEGVMGVTQEARIVHPLDQLCGGSGELERGSTQDIGTGVWETELYPCPGCPDCGLCEECGGWRTHKRACSRSEHAASEGERCPFCSYAGPNPILREYEGSYIIEPLDPVCEGHLLVIPIHHVEDFAEDSMLTCKTMSAAASYVQEVGGDWNLITSKGVAATQTVGHLHVHLIPRHKGDGLMLPWSETASEGEGK